MIKCLKVEPLDNNLIKCLLSDGNLYEYEVTDIKNFDTEIIKPLKDKKFFEKVFLEFGTPTWPNGYDICPDEIARNGRIVAKDQKLA